MSLAVQPRRGLQRRVDPAGRRAVRSIRSSSTERQPAAPTPQARRTVAAKAPVRRRARRSAAALARAASAVRWASIAHAPIRRRGPIRRYAAALARRSSTRSFGWPRRPRRQVGRSVAFRQSRAKASNSGSAAQCASREMAPDVSPRAAFSRISAAELPVNAASPVKISLRIEPSANTSARRSTVFVSPRACSGAM